MWLNTMWHYLLQDAMIWTMERININVIRYSCCHNWYIASKSDHWVYESGRYRTGANFWDKAAYGINLDGRNANKQCLKNLEFFPKNQRCAFLWTEELDYFWTVSINECDEIPAYLCLAKHISLIMLLRYQKNKWYHLLDQGFAQPTSNE